MAKNIDSLLRFVADYHSFCEGTDTAAQKTDTAQDELSLEDLDLVAAAQGQQPLPDMDPTN